MQFILISVFYYLEIENKRWKQLILYLLFIIPLFLISKYLFIANYITYFHYFDIYIAFYPIIVYSVKYLFDSYIEKKFLHLGNIAVLLYMLFNFLINMVGPLHSISIDNGYLMEFGKFTAKFELISERIVVLICCILLIIQWIKINTKNQNSLK